MKEEERRALQLMACCGGSSGERHFLALTKEQVFGFVLGSFSIFTQELGRRYFSP